MFFPVISINGVNGYIVSVTLCFTSCVMILCQLTVIMWPYKNGHVAAFELNYLKSVAPINTV